MHNNKPALNMERVYYWVTGSFFQLAGIENECGIRVHL